MAVWNDIEPGHEAEFDAWYRRQHIPERLQQPGFLQARRYIADQGSPRYCAFYWLDSVAALNTPQYLQRLAQPTRWTQRIMPWFRAMARTPCTLALDHGQGIGGLMMWVASMRGSEHPADMSERLEPIFVAGCDDPSILRMQLWVRDANLAAQSNPEQRLRGGRDQVADWIVFIEGDSTSALSRCTQRVATALADDPAQRDLSVSPCYRLLWQMSATEAPAPCTDEEAGGWR